MTGIREAGSGESVSTIKTGVPDGTVIVKYRGRFGTAVLKDRSLRVKEVMPVIPVKPADPEWTEAVGKNTYHLKNLERNAVRSIKQHMYDCPVANVSFSGGKDSTAVLLLARKAGVNDAFFLDTGIEFPETIEFVQVNGSGYNPESRRFLGSRGKSRTSCKG